MLTDFDFQPRTRILFGEGKVAMLGETAREAGGNRVLVVSDAGVIAAGHTARGIDSLRAAGCEVLLFDSVQPNPTTHDVEAGLAQARSFQPDLLVGFGGGSSMDCCKGINFLFTNGGRMQDYWGTGKATKPMLPMIAVPTTAGTGSELQSYTLISDAETHVKMACGDKKASCRVAILDPRLTLTLPPRVTALTGLDALSHALETFVASRRSAISLVFGREAWRLLASNLERVLDDPEDVEARGAMLLGAGFAGLAIENSMLGATHALANPLTARFQIPHGQAIAVMLPHVIRFNAGDKRVSQWYHELLACSGQHGFPNVRLGVEGLIEFVEYLTGKAGLAVNLSELGVSSDVLPGLAAEAAQQWTAAYNPRPVGEAELLSLYRQAL
jgi:alcohol dehydrogenase